MPLDVVEEGQLRGPMGRRTVAVPWDFHVCMLGVLRSSVWSRRSVAWPDGEDRGGTTDYCGASTCAYWVYYTPRCGRGGPVAWSDGEENHGCTTDYRRASTYVCWVYYVSQCGQERSDA
ncbi:592_t:CDS:1 [Acaulospora colombiana]|uniref:592_t:CDS:1 n=1 Tax=Acaulospora colombiana TaxID=27376 RepID=A0ACA9KP61_9GLOM|nr:592_t:CDS:1 [Acaulospora colombiana]